MRMSFVSAAVAAVCLSVSAHASMISFVTPAGSVSGGQPVGAVATFSTSTDLITIVLQNIQANPRSVSQALSGLHFTISTGQTVGTLASSLAVPRTIASNGSFTDGSSIGTGWSLGTSGGQLFLNVLGAAGPARTLIGPPDVLTYSDTNSSIAGNGPHNPFLGETATFTLTVPGVTSASTISNVTFAFGTTVGNDVVAIPLPMPPADVPEPATLALLGLSGLVFLVRRR